MMILNPSFSFPIRFARGTSTSSNSMKVEPINQRPIHEVIRMCYPPLAATPEFSILVHFTPFTFRGTTSIEIPRLPEPPVRTAAVQKSAQIPLVIHFLQPFITYVFPLLSAVVWICATSEPAVSHSHVSLRFINLQIMEIADHLVQLYRGRIVFLLCSFWVGTPAFAAPFQSSELEEVQLRFRHLDPIKRLCNLI